MRKLLPFLLIVFMLTGCSTFTEVELASHVYKKSQIPDEGHYSPHTGNFKVGKPYRVEGKWYTPQETYSYSETGIASWYGPGFHGKRTANGERFNQNELTAAHRTLQMPSLVRVTNLDNGKSIVVRVNDRGPFKRSRVIDVSSKGADLLGFKGRGTAKVRLDLLADESKTLAMAARRGESTIGSEVSYQGRPVLTEPEYQQVAVQQAAVEPVVPGHVTAGGEFLPDPIVTQQPVHPTSIYIQTGSFTSASNAQDMVRKLQGYGNVAIKPASVRGREFFRVRIGPIPSVDKADALMAKLAGAGQKQAIIVVD
jgi:rare lipoprotein A